jgi:uncharacterized membrane protein YdbT with pleckstrin-like domain
MVLVMALTVLMLLVAIIMMTMLAFAAAMYIIIMADFVQLGYKSHKRNSHSIACSYSSKSILVEKLNLATQELHFYDK